MLNIHRRECGIVVPSNALKWTAIRPNPQDFNFYEGDQVVAWGEANHMKVRGHNLLWLRPDRNPEWMAGHDFGRAPHPPPKRCCATTSPPCAGAMANASIPGTW